MKFIKNNLVVLSLAFFLIFCEVFHLLFEGIAFDSDSDWSHPVFYLTSRIGQTNLLPALIIFLFINDSNKESKSIAFGLVVWNLKELNDEIYYMIRGSESVLEIDSSFWGQIVFMLVIISFSAYAYSKWKS